MPSKKRKEKKFKFFGFDVRVTKRRSSFLGLRKKKQHKPLTTKSKIGLV